MLMAGAIGAAQTLCEAVNDKTAPWTSRINAARTIAASLMDTVRLADHEAAITELEQAAEQLESENDE
jgi:hypothetical protein